MSVSSGDENRDSVWSLERGKKPQYESFGDLASREGIRFFSTVSKVWRHTCAVKSAER